MNKDFSELETKLQKIEAILKDGADRKFFSRELYAGFQRDLCEAEHKADKIMEKDRTLKIGIVGQVKAGKSSFLNALIFDGADVLPKAATPMTAALTKIVYGEKTQAKVVYYTPKEWEDGIVSMGKEYHRKFDEIYQEKREKRIKFERQRNGIEDFIKKTKNTIEKVNDSIKEKMVHQEPYLKSQTRKEMVQEYPDLVAANDLIKLSKETDIHIDDLPQSEVVEFQDAQDDLRDYVGAKGKYTPFVKYMMLTINSESLKGCEIIDTPGLGDPIISRSRKTKDFLMDCDIVFLLSVSSQFLSQDDISLLEKTLPAKSIHRAVLVGTKFDQALLEDSSRDKLSLRDVVIRTRLNLSKSAKCRLEEKIMDGDRNGVLACVHDSMPPEFTSSLCYYAGKSLEKGEPLSEDAEHILKKMAERFTGVKKNKEMLYALSNIGNVKQKEFKAVLDEKEKIIAEHSQSFVEDRRQYFQKKLDDIEIDTEGGLGELKRADVDSLKQKLNASKQALASMHNQLRNSFEGSALDIVRYFNDIKIEVNNLSQKYRTLQVDEGTEKKEHTEKRGWFQSDRHWETTEYYKYARVSDVLDNIDAYINNGEEIISDRMKKAVDIMKLREQVKEIVYAAFQKTDNNFDEGDIVGPVENALKKITQPTFSTVSRDAFEDLIANQFQKAYVRGEDIHQLAAAQSKVLTEIENAFTEKLEQDADKAAKQIEERGIGFYDDIKQRIEERIESLQNLVINKERNVMQMEKFIRELGQAKSLLRE